jgi:class 3 adenylate cyclase
MASCAGTSAPRHVAGAEDRPDLSDLLGSLDVTNQQRGVMGLRDDVDKAVSDVFSSEWATVKRASAVDAVPDPDKMGYSEGVILPCTYLYADMADSSGLQTTSPHDTVAKIMRVFLNVSVRVIRSLDGHVRSFDGDRVMGIYSGPNKEDRAAKAAMRINWAVRHLVQPAAKSRFGSLTKSGWELRHACGIATGDTLMARAGVRGNDDMISIGVAPNLAAKLSDLRDWPRATFIGAGTYKGLTDNGKISEGKNMWIGPVSMTMGGKSYDYYKSSYWWSF